MGLINRNSPENRDGWVKITPEIARDMLATNYADQRKIKQNIVQRYAEDMKAGLWQKNGEPIQFDAEGRLRNGQHRLKAIIESGTPVELYVIHNIDSTLFDVGYRRSPSDQMRMDGIEIPATASAAAKIIAGRFGPVGSGAHGKYVREHQQDLERAYKACCIGASGRSSKRAACVVATYLMLRAGKAQYFEMETFWQVFNTREERLAGAREASAILTARKMFDGQKEIRLQRNELEIYIMAMEDFLADKPRTEPYRIQTPFHWEQYMDEIRSADGLA